MRAVDPFKRLRTESPFDTTKIIIRVYQNFHPNDPSLILLLKRYWDDETIDKINDIFYQTHNQDKLYCFFNHKLADDTFRKLGKCPIEGIKCSHELIPGQGNIITYTFVFGI